MTKQQAIIESIEHWERMRVWVKKQKQEEKPSMEKMCKSIHENWTARYCTLCKKYQMSYCCKCLLQIRYGNCRENTNAYGKVSFSKTWRTWLKASEKMVKQLRSLL